MNKRLWTSLVLVSLATKAPLWGQSSIALTCPGQAVAGASVSCTVRLVLGTGVSADSLTFGAKVIPNGASPGLTSGVLSFTDSIGGAFSTSGNTYDSISVIWAGLKPALSGSQTLGSIAFALPASAGAAQSYAVSVAGASAALGSTAVNLSVGSPNTISIGSPSTLPLISTVATAAGGQPLVAPNTWVSVYGSNFTAAGFTDTWSNSIENGALPTALDGVSVTIGGESAYVAYVSATQINVLLPNVGFGPLQVTVTAKGGTSAPYTIASQQDAPALFVWPSDQPVATHLDYTYAVANGTFAGVTTVPASPGETIVLWGAGFGPTSSPAPLSIAIPNNVTYATSSNVTVTLGGAPIAVYNGVATLTPGNAGLYQIGVTIPASLPNGTYPLITNVNGANSPTLMLAVHD